MTKSFHWKQWAPLMLAGLAIACVLAFNIELPHHSEFAVIGIGAIRPFPINPQMTAVAIAYRNPDIALIADAVLPRTPTAQEFKYLKYVLGDGFTVPETRVNRKSAPTEIDFSATEVLDKVADYGLDDLIPNEDIEADNQGVDPVGTAVAYLTNLVNLAREVRVANLVFSTGSYSAGLYTTLSGTGQWSDTANSDPVAAIGDSLDVPIMRPNVAIFGQQAWTKTRRHPKLVQAIKGTAQGAGMVSRQEFAEFFELQEVHVGSGFVNTARKGQTASLSRVWGKHASFIYRDRAAGPQAGVTFGMTAQWGDKVSGMMDEAKVGLTGSQRVRVGERVKEIITAPDVGYFFQNCVA